MVPSDKISRRLGMTTRIGPLDLDTRTIPSMHDELIEVCDRGGRMTGVVKPKAAIHRDGDWHLAVHVWIVTSDGRLLLQRRAAVKENHPDRWDVSFAGHVSAGESVTEAAVREGFEELGIRFRSGELEYLATLPQQEVLHGGTYIDNELATIFLLRRDVELAALRFQVEEVSDARLVFPDELERMAREADPGLVPHGEEYVLVLEKVTAI
jgi:isopentenyldiphosphate isomerase